MSAFADSPADLPAADLLAVRATRLGRRYGRHWALAHVDLEVPVGRILWLAGHNGSGKTTLLRLLAGLSPPTRGEIEIFGHDVRRDRRACRRKLSLVSHGSYLYPRLTALEMLRLQARLLGLSTRSEDLLPILEEVGLEASRDAEVGGFSAGMRKRLVLARLRLERPRLVLLDEPFSALDTAGQELVEEWIRAFQRDGCTLLLASHNFPRAARLAERAIVLDRGQCVWEGLSSEVPEDLAGGRKERSHVD